MGKADIEVGLHAVGFVMMRVAAQRMTAEEHQRICKQSCLVPPVAKSRGDIKAMYRRRDIRAVYRQHIQHAASA